MRKKWKETQSVTTFSSSCKDSIKSIKKSPKFSIKKRTRRPCCPKNGRREKRASRATISKSRRWISNSKKKRRFWGPTKKKEAKKVSANQWGGTTLCALLFVFFACLFVIFLWKGSVLLFSRVCSLFFYRVLPSFAPTRPSLAHSTHTREKWTENEERKGGVSHRVSQIWGLYFFFGASSNWIGSVTHRGGFDFTAFYWVLLGFT